MSAWLKKWWMWLLAGVAALALLLRRQSRPVADLLRRAREIGDARATAQNNARRTEVDRVLEAERSHAEELSAAQAQHDKTVAALDSERNKHTNKTAAELADELARVTGVKRQ